jgi:hypothetical protein
MFFVFVFFSVADQQGRQLLAASVSARLLCALHGE